jgi:propanol-preferring alcohol dehydrogenase
MAVAISNLPEVMQAAILVEVRCQLISFPSTSLFTLAKLLYVQFNKPWSLQQIPVPPLSSLGPHDILIKVAVASFCHTDIMVHSGVFGPSAKGKSGSHEPSGTIVALGSSAAKSFSLHDRIIAIGVQGLCGDCVDCNGPEEFHLSCKFAKGFTGISLPGAFQEYTIVDERFAVKIPDSMSFVKAAPLTCAGATSWRAVKRAAVKPGGWLGIVGSGGGLGHLAIQFAAKAGIYVVGVDARDVGLELSGNAGAAAVVDVRKGLDEVVKEVQKAIGARGAGRGDDLCDATIVLSDAKSAVNTSMAITKGHGLVVQVAQPDRIDFPFGEMIFRDVRLMGSNLSSRSELADQVKFVKENNVNVETTTFYGLESLPEVLEVVEAGKLAGKIVVVVDKKQVSDSAKI